MKLAHVRVTLAMVALLSPGAARAVEYHVRGLLEVNVAERGRAYQHNLLTRGDAPFDAYGVRAFADARVNPRLAVLTQLVLRDAVPPYVDGAYLMFTPFADRDLHLLAGKIPWAIGTWAPRTYPDQNPLIGAPLMYQYHSTLVWYQIPPSADALLSTAGTGQTAVDYLGYPMGLGMPLVDDSYWDVGVTLVGSARPLEYAAGATSGTPGWGSTSREENAGKTVLGRLGIAPQPWLRAGVSGAYGPYLVNALRTRIPPDRDVTDYHQKLMMADLELSSGHLALRAEAARNFWETPTVGELRVDAFYAELEIALPIGAWVAGRLDHLWFGEIRDSGGAPHPWDANVGRFEAGAGYRFARGVLGKVVYQRTRKDTERPGGASEFSMAGAQMVVGF